MKYILLILFFVTPPNKINDKDKNNPDKDKRVWALQSTATMEMATNDWCRFVADTISADQRTTTTVTTRAYCIPKDEKDLVVPKVTEKDNFTAKSFIEMDPVTRQRDRGRLLQVAPVK